MADRQHRPARQDHVSELQAALHGAPLRLVDAEQHVAGCSKAGEVVRKQGLEFRHHVDGTVAGETAGHLLQQDDVGVGKAVGDPFKVVATVEADAVLDIIARQFHDNL